MSCALPQDHTKLLTDNAVVYFNVDVAVSGRVETFLHVLHNGGHAHCCRFDSLYCLCQSTLVSRTIQRHTSREFNTAHGNTVIH